jgi:hypothetical protein
MCITFGSPHAGEKRFRMHVPHHFVTSSAKSSAGDFHRKAKAWEI